MFGSTTTSSFGGGTGFGSTPAQQTMNTMGMTPQTTNVSNPNRDFEVASPPDDTVSCLKFSPSTIPQVYLIAGSWDNNVRYACGFDILWLSFDTIFSFTHLL